MKTQCVIKDKHYKLINEKPEGPCVGCVAKEDDKLCSQLPECRGINSSASALNYIWALDL